MAALVEAWCPLALGFGLPPAPRHSRGSVGPCGIPQGVSLRLVLAKASGAPGKGSRAPQNGLKTASKQVFLASKRPYRRKITFTSYAARGALLDALYPGLPRRIESAALFEVKMRLYDGDFRELCGLAETAEDLRGMARASSATRPTARTTNSPTVSTSTCRVIRSDAGLLHMTCQSALESAPASMKPSIFATSCWAGLFPALDWQRLGRKGSENGLREGTPAKDHRAFPCPARRCSDEHQPGSARAARALAQATNCASASRSSIL